MQTDAVSQRITTAGHGYGVQLNKQGSQIVIDDWRIRGWVTDAGAPAWAAPTSTYSILQTATKGDLIYKAVGSPLVYTSNVAYTYPTDYNALAGTGGMWDLGYQDLGNTTPVTLPDGVTTTTPYVTSVNLASGKDLICFYANRFRNGYHVGIWVMQVIDDGAGHLYWGEPIEVGPPSVGIDDFNYQSQFFVTSPRLQVINGEYWILALECSKEVNVITYHLCYFRSADAVHWSDREYLAGVSGDANEAGIGINKYDTSTVFTLADLNNAYLSVSGNKVYMVCQSGTKVSAAATSLVGVTNAAMQLDITQDVPAYNLNLPTAPSAAQGSFTLLNPYKKYNGNAILVPGARATLKAGYVTSNGNETSTVGYHLIEEIKQATDISKNELSITTADYTAWLRDWASDMYWEYWSPQQSTYDQFCDLTGLNVINGRWFIGFGGSGTDLTAATLDPQDYTDEDMGYINQHRTSDGSLEFQYKFAGSHNIYLTIGGVIQGLNDRQFFAVAYWEVLGKWVIASTTPQTSGKKFYTIGPMYTGSADTPTVDTWYWGKITQWRNHVQFSNSTDRINWTTRIDYYAPAGGQLTSNQAYWGLIGHSHSISSATIGNTDASGGKIAMDNGSGGIVYWATQVTTGSSAGTVTALAGLFTQTDQPSDLSWWLVTDNGGSPSNINDYNNVLYQTSSKSMVFSSSDSPVWRAVAVPAFVRVAASTNYWIVWAFQSSLSGGQTWEWYTGGTGTTKSSTDGVNWTSNSNPAAVCMFADYDDGLVKVNAMYWTGAEPPKTIEYIAKDIAAKASVLSCTTDSFLQGSDLVAGWQPSNFGTFGDFVMDADVDTTAGPATIYFRASTQGDGTTGVKVVMGSTINIYWKNALISAIPSMQFLPTTYHLTISNQTKFIYIYVNGCLAATCYNANLVTPGYFGVTTGAGVATYTNLRIPDMTAIKSYFVVDQTKTALSALQELTQNTRYKFFMRFDNTLRIGSFLRRTSQDTYYQTVVSGNKLNTLRYSFNQLMPSGNYYAMHFSAAELDTQGKRRFKKENYTDAESNEAAYLAAVNVLARAREQASQNTLESNAIWAAEREDRVTATNPLDGTSQDYVITTLDWRVDFEQATAQQKLGLRNFVQ